MMGSGMLGCVADDFTGGIDRANELARCGMRVLQTVKVPDWHMGGVQARYDAIVVAVKTRTSSAQYAKDATAQALRWLQSQGAERFFFESLLDVRLPSSGEYWAVAGGAVG